MARINGLSRPTVYAGVQELDAPPDPRGRIRRPGGGPRWLVERDPGLLQALDELVDPDTGGDPESPLRWTCKSTRQLADGLRLTRKSHGGVRAAATRRSRVHPVVSSPAGSGGVWFDDDRLAVADHDPLASDGL
jgi:hypothetical protein